MICARTIAISPVSILACWCTVWNHDPWQIGKIYTFALVHIFPHWNRYDNQIDFSRAGVNTGDIITHVNDTPVYNAQQLSDVLREYL